VPDGHLGLTGMRARTDRLGGTLTVTTAAGQGTTIEVVVPETVPADPGAVAGGVGDPEAPPD
jgi:nitrate/nitrite-specific signal transduction histidine kinase